MYVHFWICAKRIHTLNGRKLETLYTLRSVCAMKCPCSENTKREDLAAGQVFATLTYEHQHFITVVLYETF